jgi:hypothetical protein
LLRTVSLPSSGSKSKSNKKPAEAELDRLSRSSLRWRRYITPKRRFFSKYMAL